MLLSDEVDFWSALESNADGYVLWPTTLLPTAIEVVTHGGVWLGPLITEYLLRGPGFSTLQSFGPYTLTSMPPLFQLLSGREREVLNLLLDGLTNQQIANSLDLRVGTVKVHVGHILGKLKLEHRSEAIVKLTKLVEPLPQRLTAMPLVSLLSPRLPKSTNHHLGWSTGGSEIKVGTISE